MVIRDGHTMPPSGMSWISESRLFVQRQGKNERIEANSFLLAPQVECRSVCVHVYMYRGEVSKIKQRRELRGSFVELLELKNGRGNVQLVSPVQTNTSHLSFPSVHLCYHQLNGGG